ncbi:helix-turn-helix transcriptional regulator [Jejuia pallidilutea]|uniref:helix-turn-helix transcriptional regulator n=1 Tax=Jejuia pallidilutea TaxID=504487 RepID=UPI0005A73E3F|nr:LuxR C-terminal-related transcriptional regulator [Jejuia pallidilutea]
MEEQKSRIKELYTNLHINSSTILDKSESHLELVNELNIDFFRKIDETYPQLNKSEVIICYYILIGFNNKEISVFLNTSIRSVESKRYRISKKINFDKERTTLVEHLHKTFKDTLHSTIHDN